jgi:hypothetical protein
MPFANKLSGFTIGEDVIHSIHLTKKDFKSGNYLSMRKAKVVSINKASLSIQYYSYTKTELNCNTTIYRWNDTLEDKKILVRDIQRIYMRKNIRTKAALALFDDWCVGSRSDGKYMDYDDDDFSDLEIVYDDDDEDDDYDLSDLEIVYVDRND